MGAWNVLFIVCLAISAVMITLGVLFEKKVPQKINYFFGYRTPLSMKNHQTWNFANSYSGNMIWHIGAVLLLITLAVMIPIHSSSMYVISTCAVSLIMAHIFLMIVVILLTENALREKFDNEGNFK